MRRIVRISISAVTFLFFACSSFASGSFIENLSKIRNSKGYIFKINYQTKDEWTDGLMFKLFCVFDKGAELSFTSTGHNNVKKGWHKTEIRVPRVYRDRYGYIKDYRVEMYQKGLLVSLKSL
ncbi:MAG: hypothetical protein KJ706_08185 [Candidatus Omnitrophica bacterium]|nr:hypothetical protein [Candidatus Omnitrophota bacterium]MBU4589943.1 hypothetical protein [Candidatus Omnitrophota bacterium]